MSGLEKFGDKEPKKEEAEKPVTSYTAPVASDNYEMVEAIERLDEQQIIESMKGRVIDKLFYELPITDPRTGEKVIALSWAGVKFFTLQLKHITVEKVELTETETTHRAIAWALDKARDVRIMGAAEQSKMMTQRDGTRKTDEFALAKVVSKSQRNALRGLIPETMVSEAYREWRNRPTQPK